MTRTTLESAIAAMAAQLSGTAPRGIDPAMPFSLLGLDSVTTVELAAILQKTTGFDVPPEVVLDAGNPRVLAARLRRMTECGARSAADPFELMLADARSAPHPRRDVRDARERTRDPRRGGLRNARTILLTGATGFLGRWIAREVVEGSEATLLCLVRGSDASPQQRLFQSLQTAGVARKMMERRVVTVRGDLTLPGLGLAPSEYDRLAVSVDAICHAGAAVNWIHSYASLRHANVLGTMELLELARLANAEFHLVSSISTCYSTLGPDDVDENYDSLPHLRGIHLGYAQTKVVAEALVRHAAGRGVRSTIYRPALISGHSTAGDYNPDDLLALLIRGCVQMGTAPDLDWTLDVLPVNHVARRIVELSSRTGTFHLKHPRPRHWRECVLWMRMYGYALALEPFPAWLHRLEREIDAMAMRGERHPLAPLRRFFAERPAGCDGLTLPQLYEDVRRTRAASSRTEQQLAEQTRHCVELDGTLLEHYFAAFQSSGELPMPPARVPPRRTNRDGPATEAAGFDEQFFDDVAGPALGRITRAELLHRGAHHSVVSELTAWHSHRPAGLFAYRLHTESGSHDVLLKAKPRDREVIAVGEALAWICGDEIGAAYTRWQDQLGLALSHLREVEIYRQQDVRLTRHMPRVLGSIADDSRETWAIVIELVQDATHKDAVGGAHAWDAPAIASVIDGLAEMQSSWYRRHTQLRSLAWLGVEKTTASMAAMHDLWSALAAHARPRFCAWADPSISAIHRRLISTLGTWWRTLESAPRTLIHNDFNPRNICLRPSASGRSLCAYDWELAAAGVPQHDLAEFLCFVVAPDVDAAVVEAWIERHRLQLELQSGCPIDPREWREGFRCSLYDVLVDRLSMYALIHRIRQQSFLPRVVRTWRRLYEFFPLPESV